MISLCGYSNEYRFLICQLPFFSVASVLLALLILLPIFIILLHVVFGSYTVLQHLAETVLTDYLLNSLLLSLGVCIGVLCIGVPTAWLVSLYEFPLRKFFTWALLLPLAMPAYIIAYTYTGLLDFAGPVQTLIRDISGWQYGEYWFFEIRSLTGAMLMLTMVLYPYVYLLARTAFVEQSASIIEAAQTMGNNRTRGLWLVALPMARPAIVTGLSLALMETLADYGTVQYFGISTFTTGIFRTFFGFGDVSAAAQLAGMLLLFVSVLIFCERYSRKQSRYYQRKGQVSQRKPLHGKSALLASMVCFLPLLLGFIIPVIQLTYWALVDAEIDQGFLGLAWNSFYLAFLAACIAVICGAVLAYAKRLSKLVMQDTAISVAGMGYALPGTIIAVGVLIPLAWLDHWLIATIKEWFDLDMGLLLSGTLFALLFAYLVRFLSVSLGTIDSGLQKISPSIDAAARLMRYKPLSILRLIHFPLLKGSLLTAFLIVFVDVLKELPATLILRPFNFNTLAVKAYEMASDERLVDAAPASLLIIAVGLLPVILLSRSINNSADFTRD